MLVMLNDYSSISAGGKLFLEVLKGLKVLLTLVFLMFIECHSPAARNLGAVACRALGLGWGDLAGVVSGLVLIDSRPGPQDGPAIVVCRHFAAAAPLDITEPLRQALGGDERPGGLFVHALGVPSDTLYDSGVSFHRPGILLVDDV